MINGQWTRPRWAELDELDPLNFRDDPYTIDRHDCGVIDANLDGVPDLYCLVGANRGLGVGYNEVYLTRKDGSLFKIYRHALQRFIGARTRHTTTLKGHNGTEYLFISASYGRRQDGRPNKHAMFRRTGRKGLPVGQRFFSHVRGDWQRFTNASCAISVDINQDGREDLIVCNEKIAGLIYIQFPGGWRRTIPPQPGMNNWRAAAVADFSGDGIPDLAVTYHDENASYLRIFRGQPEYPYFEFIANAWYQRTLPFAAPDIEAIDANGDGLMDLYVVQADERRIPNNYCGGILDPTDWWSGGPSRIMPPASFTPPPDQAPDLLLLRNQNQGAPKEQRMLEVQMQHAEPGCGYFVKKFNDRSLVLAQGGFVRPGHQLLLEWE